MAQATGIEMIIKVEVGKDAPGAVVLGNLFIHPQAIYA